MTQSILSTISHSTVPAGLRMVIAGSEKVGKTTFASSAPYPLLIPLEVGYSGVSVDKTAMIDSYDAVEQLMAECEHYLSLKQFPFKTLIFDSGTALERLIHERVLMTDPTYGKGNKKALTMESALGGYGKAYQYANELFDGFLKKCDRLSTVYGINIVITCHVFAATMIDPNSGEYNSWDLLLHSPKNQKTYGKREMITQWADVVGFLYEPMFVSKDGNMARGVSANKGRVMGVSRTPSYVAGNRFGVNGEISIPKEQGWNYLADAIYKSCGANFFNQNAV